LAHRSLRFIEEEPVPPDAAVVGQAWAKSNKDGSPDRRFRDNYQLPIALYASLTFTSPSGLHEEFQISNPGLAERFARAWNAFQLSFASPGERQPVMQTPFARPHAEPGEDANEEPLDVATAFAKESDKARSLATEHGKFWEYLLTEELLRTKLSVVQKEYNELDTAPLPILKSFLNGSEYMNWLHEKLDELTPLIQEITDSVTQHLPPSWGKPGEAGDALQILRAANEIISRCRALVNWERDIRSTAPPAKLKRLGATLHGTAASLFTEVMRLPDELARAVEAARRGPAKVNIQLTFPSPPQIGNFLAEMEKVKKHPESVVS